MQYVAEKYHLSIEVDAKECEIPEDERSRMQPSLDRIGEAVQEFAASELWLTVVYHPNSQVYHFQAKLKLPGHTIITGDADPHLDTAFQNCVRKLLRRIEACKADPDYEAVDQARRNAAMSQNIVAPTEPDSGRLGKAASDGDYPAFRRALLGHEEWLRMRVGRWVQRYPELQERIGDRVEIRDLVEDVLLNAFESYSHRPDEIALHEWLDDLIDPSLRRFLHNPKEERASISFAQSVSGAPARRDQK